MSQCYTCALPLPSDNAPCPECLRNTGNPWPHLKNPLVDLVDKHGLAAAMRHALESEAKPSPTTACQS